MALFGGGGQQSSANTSTKKYEKGEIIVQEGSSSHEMFVLVSGSVGAYQNYQKFNQVDMGIIRPGECFGENALFFDRLQPATMVALSDSSVMSITAKTATEVFSRQPDVAYSIIGGLVKKLDSLTRTAVKDTPAETQQVLSKSSSLFPEGHGNYSLPLTNDNDTCVFSQKCKCPLCHAPFESLQVLTSRLKREKTDKDLRVRYAGVEPMYYDIISCPNCLYSAPADKFPEASPKVAENLNRELNKFLGDVEIKIGMERDTFTVFAGYYLALRSVPVCFDDYQFITSGLWQKLSRMYKDCGDEKMYLTASMQAIQEYEFVYQKMYTSEKQSQQICFILGDLYERLQNYEKAKSFFFLAKSNRDGIPAMKIEADKRLEEIKAITKS